MKSSAPNAAASSPRSAADPPALLRSGRRIRRTLVQAAAENTLFFIPRRARPLDVRPCGFIGRGSKRGVLMIDDTGIDTYSDERFFSYRRSVHRGEPDYGRHVHAIVLERDNCFDRRRRAWASSQHARRRQPSGTAHSLPERCLVGRPRSTDPATRNWPCWWQIWLWERVPMVRLNGAISYCTRSSSAGEISRI